jgi:hypothetical protein
MGMVLWVRGPLRAHAEALANFLRCVWFTLPDSAPQYFRLLRDSAWSAVPNVRDEDNLATLFGAADHPGSWTLELAETAEGITLSTTTLEIADLATVLGLERASYIRILFGDRITSSKIATLANWTINNLPVWWGSAGWLFNHSGGRNYPAFSKIAAQAKRYWGVQIQDSTALQWDALRGMPGINWLSLIGNEFAASHDLDLDPLVARISATGGTVFHRWGHAGVVIAAGPMPLTGDVNTGEEIGAYFQVAESIAPLLLEEHTPLTGPFGRPEVMKAWLSRFTDPQQWRDCDISDD